MKKILLITAIWVGAILQLSAQTGFSGESPTFTVDTKKPVINLNTPNGGGSYSYEEPLQITWSAIDDSFGDTPISTGISTQEGGEVNWLGQNLTNSGTTSVSPPQTTTNFAKAHIKAVDAFGNEAVDMSDGYFELFEPCEDATANAGDDTTICEDNDFMINDASAENYSSLLWSGGAGEFDDATLLNPVYTPNISETGTVVTLCLIAYAEEGCENATDCMELTIFPSPTVDAGEDISICDNVISIELSGNISNYASSLWQTLGDGLFSNETGPNTEYYPGPEDLQTGNVVVCLMAYPINPPCELTSEDCMSITFIPSPEIDPLSDEIICIGEEFSFSGVSAIDYSSLVWTTDGDGTFDDINIPDPVYTPGQTDILIQGVTLCVEALPLAGCTTSANECMMLNLYSPPTANAGIDQTISSGEMATLSATAENFSSMMWATSGDGVFSDPNSISTDYTPGIQDIQTGSVELCFSVEGEDPCFMTITDCLDLEITPVIEAHFTPIWISPYNPMSVYILLATLDELDLQPGDEIGLFDIDPISGNEICVGAGTLSEVLTGANYLEIITSMDDGSNPEQAIGFTPGHSILYKYYNPEFGEINEVEANYPYPDYDEVFAAQGTAFAELSKTTRLIQTIPLNAAWNMMSFMVEPDTMDMLHIVQPLIDQDLLYKVLDEDGGSVNHLPFPPPIGQWTNSIGNMACTEGYYIKVNESCQLTLEGVPIVLPLEIELRQGWNMIGYPSPDEADAMNVVQPLIDAGLLYKMIDEIGGTIFHIPFPPPYGQWTNTIGNLKSGEGYYIKVNQDCALTIDTPEKASVFTAKILRKPITQFDPTFVGNPYMPMSIALTGIDDLSPGDEVGIFDGEICVGAAVVEDSEYLVIPVAMDDPTTAMQDGFVQANEISAEVWQQQSQQTLRARLIYLDGVETFQPLETYIGELLPLITGVAGLSDAGISVNVVPNPFNDHTWVYFNSPVYGRVEMELFDLTGQKQSVVIQDYFAAGNGKIRLDSQNLQAGCYILKFTFKGISSQSTVNKKLIIR